MDSDPTVVIGATLKSLGYSWFSSSEKEVAEATVVLRDQVSTVRPMFLTAMELRDRMVSGELCAAQAYNGDAAFAMAENEDLAFFVPKEGSDIWFDVLAIPRDAKNKAAAEVFINYILRPDVQAAINNYTGYPTPNQAAIKMGYIDEESLANPVIYPDTDLLEPWVVLDGEAVALRNKAWAQVEAETMTR
jgi:spermidine/putrescine transport system substrate-binding protein